MDRPPPTLKKLPQKEERAPTTTARAEVVDILAIAVFTLLLKGEVPRSQRLEPERQGECS